MKETFSNQYTINQFKNLRENIMRKFKKLTMTLVALFALTTGAWAQEVTKIAVGGSTQNNNYVPLPGNLAQNYTKCEFVYPATMLTALNGYDIKRMTFGASASNQNWGDARFQVFLKEVDFTTISAYSGTDNATTVYEGELYLFGTSEMEITFTIPYTYHGGNLLIGVYQTVKGNRGGLPQWLGENATGASVRGSNSSSLDAVTTATQCNFLPKVTFTCVSSAAEPEAQENVTIIFNDLGLANEQNLTTGPLTVGNIELNFAQNNGLNPPKFYTNGSAARIYMGNSMSISAGGATITKIVFNLTQGTPTFNTGSYNATTSTWEGEATTLTLSNEMASGQVRITSMDVYYSVASAAGEAGYSVTLKEGTEDATSWQGKAGEGEYQALPLTGLEAGTAVSVKYSGTKRVKSVKAEKKSSAPTLKDALADGATVVINYTWFDDNVTTFTYTNNGGNYTGNTTGTDAGYFNNSMSVDGTTLRFTASNPDVSEVNVSIDFDTDTNEYAVSKDTGFTSFTISVNGTDVTSQLTEVVDETGD